MNDQMVTIPQIASPLKKSLTEAVSRLDSKSILFLGGMGCLTIILCVGFACFSGSELNLSATGFSIRQPTNSSNLS